MNSFEESFQLLTSQEQKLLGDDTLFYLAAKVENYLEIGPRNYAQEDAFGYPDHTYSERHLNHIKRMSKQLLNGKGLTLKNPIEVYRAGFSAIFLKTFHFKIHSKEFFTNEDKSLSLLVCSSHVIDKRNLSLYFKIIKDLK